VIASEVRVRGSQVHATLALMQDLAEKWHKKPFFVDLARKIVSGIRGLQNESKAVRDWVQAHVAYRRDPIGAEWVQDPFETVVKQRAGDCDDMAVVAMSLLMALGHDCEATAVQWQGRSAPSHAVCVDHSAQMVVDPCSPSHVWPPGGRKVAAMMGAL
jgi:Transglutaminase-like superfamily